MLLGQARTIRAGHGFLITIPLRSLAWEAERIRARTEVRTSIATFTRIALERAIRTSQQGWVTQYRLGHCDHPELDEPTRLNVWLGLKLVVQRSCHFVHLFLLFLRTFLSRCTPLLAPTNPGQAITRH